MKRTQILKHGNIVVPAICAFFLTATLVVPQVSNAATLWPPLKMAKALTAHQYPAGSTRTVCKGIQAGRAGLFPAFRCFATSGQTTTTVFARPLSSGAVCASTVSLKTCKPLTTATVKLAGDPRVCTDGTRSDGCVHEAAAAAATAHWKQATGYSQPAPACTAKAVLVYVCVMGQAGYQQWTYTVTFTKGTTAWATSVTP